jgi:hypothetical protein
VRTEPIDLDLFGRRVRILCDDVVATQALRTALDSYVVNSPGPLGFVVRSPKRGQRLWVLLDRSGFVLGRSRDVENCLAMLGSHLSVFCPPHPGTVRLRWRALIDSDDAVLLVAPPILMTPPLVERRLARTGHRLLDQLTVDVDAASGELKLRTVPLSGLHRLDPGLGHASADERPRQIRTLIAPTGENYGTSLSTAQLVQFLADTAIPSTSRELRITAAERLANGARLALVDSGSIYAEIDRLG